jgi:hypothetical protein
MRLHTFVAALALALGVPAAGKDSSKLEHTGKVESRPPGKTGRWVIGGRTFEVTARTEIDEEEGPLAVGACASVEYGADGVVRELDSEPARDCSEAPKPVR